MATPAQRALSHQPSEPSGGKQQGGSAYLLNQSVLGHACSLPLRDTAAVHWQRL